MLLPQSGISMTTSTTTHRREIVDKKRCYLNERGQQVVENNHSAVKNEPKTKPTRIVPRACAQESARHTDALADGPNPVRALPPNPSAGIQPCLPWANPTI
jgi:hypothetical protein